MADENDVRVALRVLRAGVPGEHPAIDDDTVDLWKQALASVAGPVVNAAALRWVEEQPKFPNLNQFLALAQEESRVAALRRRELERPAGWVGDEQGLATCAECGGSDFVEVADPKLPTKTFVRPCSACEPAAFDRWRGGHMAPSHDRRSCPDEVCQRTAPGGRRKAHA